jgi:U6 snRNA-associated Sm-like protein LSm1
MLADARERIIVGNQFGEVHLGLHLVRGENVVLLGEVDLARDPPANLEKVSEAEIKQARKAEQEADKMKGLIRTRFDFLDGMD